MRIGVVCEGPTDFYAISSFFGHSLSAEGVHSEFVPLQPKMDNTLPEGGWGNVLLWLKHNSPAARIQKYFGGGLFGGDLSSDPLDALLIQLDSDMLGHQPFQAFVLSELDHPVAVPVDPAGKANEVRTILSLAARLVEATEADVQRHVLAPAVEATEAWCIAAFTAPTPDCEVLVGQDLVDQFMCVLEASEGSVPTPPYATINKTMKRRERFCQNHATGSDRVKAGCASFLQAHNSLLALE